ncbi:MAG: hypothetical protein QOH51_714 [Acidobacteriota bacterium]|nr:hypothetical protein [Acidobacteriota bacterium]
MTYVRRITRAVLLPALAVICGACASMTRPASSERPRANDAPRFAVLAASDERRNAALAGWKTVVGEQAAAGSPVPELEPVTETLKGLPAILHDYPRLPLVVIKDARTQSEEETRESLRRFLSTAAPLLGTDLRQLSLIGVSDAPAAGTGAKRALYQQNPFAYPLRNGYGVVDVTFTPDLRVVKLSSTAIPEAERLARTLNTVAKTLTAEQAVAALSNRPITYTDRGGTQQTRTVTQADSGVARQLVVFPIRRDADPATLELHIAWEVSVGSTDAPLLVYVDAATGDLLGASQGS